MNTEPLYARFLLNHYLTLIWFKVGGLVGNQRAAAGLFPSQGGWDGGGWNTGMVQGAQRGGFL
jgi:hypothetical protein